MFLNYLLFVSPVVLDFLAQFLVVPLQFGDVVLQHGDADLVLLVVLHEQTGHVLHFAQDVVGDLVHELGRVLVLPNDVLLRLLRVLLGPLLLGCKQVLVAVRQLRQLLPDSASQLRTHLSD